MPKILIDKDPRDKNQFLLYDSWERVNPFNQGKTKVFGLVASVHCDTLSDLMGSEWLKELNNRELSAFPVEAEITIELL